MATLAETIDRHGIDVLDHLDRDVEVPVLAGLQCQGDVAVIPAHLAEGVTARGALAPVPSQGVALVSGQHTHTLIGDASWTRDVTDPEGLAVAVVDVATEAYLAHVEHGYIGLAPGSHVIRRQREHAEVARLVAD